MVEVAREHQNRMLDMAKVHVCSVVNTEVAGSLVVAVLPCCSGWLPKKNCVNTASKK